MLCEATCVALILCLLLRLRPVLGLAPVYTTLGVLFHLAGLLAGTVYVRITPELAMSPGSVALFPANLFAVLCVYLQEDAYEARRLIYGLLAANLVVVLMGMLLTQQLASPLVLGPQRLAPDVFLQQPRIAIVGALVLYLDTILIVLVYEWLLRRIPRPRLFAIAGAMVSVLSLDTLLFVTGSFVESPSYLPILISGLGGKVAVGLCYALILSLYLSLGADPRAALSERPTLTDMFQLLTYRQRFEALQVQVAQDALTGVHNRRHFDEALPRALAHASKQAPVALMMIDVDRFKAINDTAGHTEGDRVLRKVADTLSSVVRGSDQVCRYGGEEFAVIMPGTSAAAATKLATRVRQAIARECRWQGDGGQQVAVTATIGVADSSEAERSDVLVELADRRLLAGKRGGRDRVITFG